MKTIFIYLLFVVKFHFAYKIYLHYCSQAYKTPIKTHAFLGLFEHCQILHVDTDLYLCKQKCEWFNVPHLVKENIFDHW